jgi:hypothetical protein
LIASTRRLVEYRSGLVDNTAIFIKMFLEKMEVGFCVPDCASRVAHLGLRVPNCASRT